MVIVAKMTVAGWMAGERRQAACLTECDGQVAADPTELQEAIGEHYTCVRQAGYSECC
jgi:hypothetical protein